MIELIHEDSLREAVAQLAHVVEAAAAGIIFVGAVVAFARFVSIAAQERRTVRFVEVRLDLGRFLALGLEFQLASDVLRTAVAPSFEQIGQLAAIAAIRTALNYFLEREIKMEQAEIDRGER